MSFADRPKWTELQDWERQLLWDKYSSLIQQRAGNAYSWGNLFVKSCILINSGALATTIAFIGNVLPKEEVFYSDYRLVMYKFLGGLAAAVLLLLLATYKTYRDMCKEVEFFAQMVTNEESVSLVGRPNTRIGMHIPIMLVIGAIAGILSVALFAWGIYDGTDLIAALREQAIN